MLTLYRPHLSLSLSFVHKAYRLCLMYVQSVPRLSSLSTSAQSRQLNFNRFLFFTNQTLICLKQMNRKKDQTFSN